MYIIIYFFAFDVNIVSIDRVTSVLHLTSPDITRARIGPVPGGTEELRFYGPWLSPVLSQVYTGNPKDRGEVWFVATINNCSSFIEMFLKHLRTYHCGENEFSTFQLI